MLRRISALLAVIVLGAAAPARAWCEAACLAPAPQTTPHCPTHEPAGATTTIAGSAIDECPALDSARPTVPARLDAQAAVTVAPASEQGARSRFLPSLVRRTGATTVFERCTPLRI